MKAHLHVIDLETVNVPHPKVLKIGYQSPVNPECGAPVALPGGVGFDHELIAVPSIP